jgi:hypothetical protein
MKTFLIIIGVIFLLFVGSQIYFYKSSRTIEEYRYVVTTVYEDFEIRTYEASLFTSVKLDTDLYRKASSKGFSILGGYIFGKNEKKEQISMTSPVKLSLKEEMIMQFLVPKNLTKDDLPLPDNSSIEFVEVSERKMAAISFGGWANDKKIEKYKLRLIALLDKNQIKHTNNFSLLGYNPPYELFFRKNEIIVELD